MSQYNTVSPAEVGIMSGLMGAGIGYTIAPRKYNLEQLLTQKPDVFEKTLSKELMSNANADQHAAHKVLLEGREILNKAHQSIPKLIEISKIFYRRQEYKLQLY